MVLIFRYGWDKMEQWAFLTTVFIGVFHLAVFTIFRKRINSEAVRAKRLETEKERLYYLNRFNEVNYARLTAELEKLREERARLLEE